MGIRPRADQILEINPLLPAEVTPGTPPIRYFAVQGVLYHGHDVTAIFDADGSRYGKGRGLSVFVDGKRAFGPAPLGGKIWAAGQGLWRGGAKGLQNASRLRRQSWMAQRTERNRILKHFTPVDCPGN